MTLISYNIITISLVKTNNLFWLLGTSLLHSYLNYIANRSHLGQNLLQCFVCVIELSEVTERNHVLSHMQNLAKQNKTCACGTLKHEKERSRKAKRKRLASQCTLETSLPTSQPWSCKL